MRLLRRILLRVRQCIVVIRHLAIVLLCDVDRMTERSVRHDGATTMPVRGGERLRRCCPWVHRGGDAYHNLEFAAPAACDKIFMGSTALRYDR